MMHVSPFLRYLAIPADFGAAEPLRWAKTGEAIETHTGKTFIFAKMLPPFFEGFASQRPLIHFGYVLDLLCLLGHADETLEGVPRRLWQAVRDAFRSSGTSLRNAGAFFGIICSDIPPAWLSGMDGRTLARWLATKPVYPAYEGWENAETPPLDVPSFRRLIADKLQDFSDKDLFHWFRFGRGPMTSEGKRLAEEVVEVKPPAFRGTLDELLRERPRLAGSLPLVGTMVSALSLPPRRGQPPELPLGGYADVTNRGEPERLLPSQFALDGDEFIRRFAEKELLFFRREEPHQRTREELVLLLDQGVRTWGAVRLALGAAVLAFRKLAERRNIPFRIRFGGRIPCCVDPASCDLPKLADRLEESDLSAHPGGLVDMECDNAQVNEVDIVLLTHPRSLADERVRRSGSRLPEGKRLFALTVDDDGAVQFSQVRGGEALPISRFRVDFPATAPPSPVLPLDDSLWKGDVEPVPFPFPIAPFQKIVALAFDAETRHLLVATHKGYLHLWNLENGKLETLPRPFQGGRLCSAVQAVMGMRGGFVVGGKIENNDVAAHYDLTTRSLTVHRLGRSGPNQNTWYAFLQNHSVAVRQVALCWGLDLTTGAMYAEPERTARSNAIAQQAYLWALDDKYPFPWIPVLQGFSETETCAPYVAAPPHSDWIQLIDDDDQRNFPLIEDGKPIEIEAEASRAQFSGNVLAFLCRKKSGDVAWRFFDAAGSNGLIGFSTLGNCDPELCRLSPDGSLFAQPMSRGEITVWDVRHSAASRLITEMARVHSNLSVQLGRRAMNIVIGGKRHALSWREGPLTHRYERVGKDETLDSTLVADKRGSHHPFANYDPGRFVSVASHGFDVFIDVAGQVIVFDPHRQHLVCIIYVRRDRFAFWMPDGTVYGPSDLTGRPAAPDALERLGAALRQAVAPVEA